ncbi:MAG: TRAP transporter small permease [Burkholderiaceae bacterium]|nr:TRAP transporter small permease [Burkholderiaceae bacterium]
MKIPFAGAGFRSSYRCCDQAMVLASICSAVCLVVAMCIIVADVATRRSIDLPLAGTMDLTQLFVMSCAFLAMPLAFLRNAHVSVEFVTDKLPSRVLLAAEAVAAAIGCAFIVACLVCSVEQALLQVGNGDRSQTIGIPIFWYWAPLLIGFALSALATLMIAVRSVWKASCGFDPCASVCSAAAQETGP